MPLPGVDAILVVDRLGWLLEPLKQQFLPMLGNPVIPVEVLDQDGILTLTFKTAVGPAPMDFQPVLRFDSKADRLMLSTRPAFLKIALEGKDLLAGDADFKKAWTGLPEEGNAAIYLSPRLLNTIRSNVSASLAASKEPEEAKALGGKVLDFLTPYLGQPQALCMANLPEGSLGAANLAIPMGPGGTLATITTLSILSSLAVPAINTVNVKASQMSMAKEGKQLGQALNAYAASNNGQYPPALDTLREHGAEALLSSSKTVWMYNPTLTADSPDEAILLASEASTQGPAVRCVVRKSGASEMIPEAQFEAQRDDNLR